MYEVAMSSRVEGEQINQNDPLGNVSNIAGLREEENLSDKEGYDLGLIPLTINVGIVCFLCLLAYSGYKMTFSNDNVSQVSSVMEFDPLEDVELTTITSDETPNFTVPVKREFVTQPGIDPTTTASIGSSIELDQIPAMGADDVNSGSYIIQPGDTLNAIAQQLGIDTADLIEMNAILDPSRIRPGTRLVTSKWDAAR